MDNESDRKEHKSKKKKGRIHWKRFAITVLVTAIATLIVEHVVLPKIYSKDGDNKSAVYTESVKLRLEDIGELATQSAYIKEIEEVKDSNKLFGKSVPFTKTHIIYSRGYNIKAGIDFTKADYDVDESSHTITVTLPEAEIQSVTPISDSFHVYLDEQGLLNNYTPEESNEADQDAMEQAQKDAVSNGLLTEAQSNAEDVVKTFLSASYSTYQYEFETQETSAPEETEEQK